MNIVTIRRPDDFHVHLRRGPIMSTVLPYTANCFARAVVMPNTTPPILTAADAIEHRLEISSELKLWGFRDFEPIMSIQITDETTREIIRDAKSVGEVIVGKVYPKGVTTGSHNGVTDFKALYPVFEEMEEVGMVLSLHGQVPQAFCLDREENFLFILFELAERFPDLRIVMEHISTEKSVEAVKWLRPNVAATITLHHLMLTLHDVLSYSALGREGLNPHHYCQPIPQRPGDRAALRKAVMSGNRKFFFGSDSAPHLRENKESSCGCAGVFSAPMLLPGLVELFIALEAIEKLEPFVSEFGARFYKLPLTEEKITLERGNYPVPLHINGIVPFCAGKKFDWQVTH